MEVWSPPGTNPLVFDAEELRGFLANEKKGRVRNPALVLEGVPEGARAQLSPTLDEDSVTSLSLQAHLSTEGADTALQKAPLLAKEHNLLQQVIIPSMLYYLQQNRYVQATTRLYRKHVPEALQKMLHTTGEAVRFIFEHRLLRVFALLLTRVVHTYVCMATFGLTGRDWDNLRINLLRAIDPQNHYDFLRLLVEGLCVVMQCITMNTMECIGGAIKATLRTLGWTYNLIHSVCGASLSFVRPLMVLYSYVPRVNLWMGEEGSLGGYMSAMLYETVGLMTDTEQIKDHVHKKAAVHMAHPFWKEMHALYNAPVYHMAGAITLWLIRRMDTEKFLEWLKDMGEVCAWLAPLHDPLAQALRSIPNGTKDAILVAFQTIRRIQAVRGLRALLWLWADLVHCLAAYLQRQIGIFLGISSTDTHGNASCCGKELRATFTSILQNRDKELLEVDARHQQTEANQIRIHKQINQLLDPDDVQPYDPTNDDVMRHASLAAPKPRKGQKKATRPKKRHTKAQRR